MTGQTIDGVGYVATPPAGSGPGLIVLQEWWGLVPHIKDVVDRFAQEGYVAIAPDLFQGTTTTSPDEAGRLLMALNIEQTATTLQRTVEFLLNHDAVTSHQVGVVGFCMGGQLALLTATVSDRIGAVVNFYGIHPKVSPDFSQLSAPVLGLFAADDTFVTPAAVQQLEAAVQTAGKSMTTHTYPGVTHAFFNDTRPEVYNAEAAADAWQRTLAFLADNLAPV
ncbi:MAG: dienelactone hydrolase family protein [Kaiparowitsia implicata GSE-PSE-MK54-09C]|nr:dienelactone hydrolase family protein [Kaiparowitsia implicata GSE-PSE-MK54-09C]